MENRVNKLLLEKKDTYRSLKKEIRHQQSTAKKLGFMLEVEKLEIDRRWCDEIIELIEEVQTQLSPITQHKQN